MFVRQSVDDSVRADFSSLLLRVALAGINRGGDETCLRGQRFSRTESHNSWRSSMGILATRPSFLFSLVFISLTIGIPTSAEQPPSIPPLITQRVDETRRTVLQGNTHPLARPQYDRGAAPPDLPMNRMLLVLKRNAAQEHALLGLL